MKLLPSGILRNKEMLGTRSLQLFKASDAQPKHDARFYSCCFMGGILSCGTTHTAICPLDLVKCRRQTNPTIYKSLWDGLKQTAKEGWNRNGLYRGWQPTFFGYAMQGFFKFGGYEMFKDIYINMMGEERASRYKNTIYLAASASAEFFADIFLCPMEATKVRIQTSPVEMNFPNKLSPAIKQITAGEGMKALWKGIVPLWCRQIPYTMVKFATFENIVGLFYRFLLTKPRESYSKATQLTVTFASGYIAGVFCALVSHPFDTCVSKMNNSAEKISMLQAMKILGWKGCWNGLGTRILMIGTLTGLQWWIYDTWKTFCGYPSSGGH